MAAIAWLLYAPALTADFVYDARAKILISPFIHDRTNLPDVLTGRVIARDVLDNNRPGNLLSLMIDAALYGKRPMGYHATSITLHAAVCAMLFLLIVRLGVGVGPAFAAALLFAVHPMNCEAVCEVSYREDLLVAASIIATLLAAMEFMRQPGRWRNILLGAFCCFALLFGVSSKENGVAGPVVLSAYWFLWRRKDPRAPWAGLLAGAWIVVVGFLVALTLRPEHSIIFIGQPGRLGGSLENCLLIQSRIWAMQFSQIVGPHGFCADYGPDSLTNYSIWLSAVADLLVIAALIFAAFRSRLAALGVIWFWAALLPVSNIVPLFIPMADRFLYVPLLGAAILLAQALETARQWRPPALAATALAICACAVITFRRESVWHDSLALWQETSLQNPQSLPAQNNLGWALLDADRTEEAAFSFQRAISLTASHLADPWAGLALARDASGQTAAANDAYRRAIQIDPRYAHPQELVRALTTEPDVAGKLEILANRIRKR